MGIPCEIFLVLTKNCSPKTAQHLTARIFALDFCADDAALLAQGKEDKEKYKQKDCCEAIGVRFLTAQNRHKTDTGREKPTQNTHCKLQQAAVGKSEKSLIHKGFIQ